MAPLIESHSLAATVIVIATPVRKNKTDELRVRLDKVGLQPEILRAFLSQGVYRLLARLFQNFLVIWRKSLYGFRIIPFKIINQSLGSFIVVLQRLFRVIYVFFKFFLAAGDLKFKRLDQIIHLLAIVNVHLGIADKDRRNVI